MESIKCYDLITVHIGEEIVDARPIQWDGKDYDGFGHNSEGQDLKAVMYATTCPRCANLINMTNNDLSPFANGSFKLNFKDKAHLLEHNDRCPLMNDPVFSDLDDVYVVLDEDVEEQPPTEELPKEEELADERTPEENAEAILEPEAVPEESGVAEVVSEGDVEEEHPGPEDAEEVGGLIDPIAEGLLDLDINTELQELLDEENI